MFKKIFLVLILIELSQSFFSPDSAVITLDSQAFEKKVLDSNDIWLILFYSENEEFNTLKPEYEKAALAMKDMFHLGAIDAKLEKSLLSKYKITYTPTMKFFGTNKDEEPKDFARARGAFPAQSLADAPDRRPAAAGHAGLLDAKARRRRDRRRGDQASGDGTAAAVAAVYTQGKEGQAGFRAFTARGGDSLRSACIKSLPGGDREPKL
jgi:hypothetical protein